MSESILSEPLPGIFSAKIPLPRNPLKSINSYIIPDGERTLVIDLGFDLPECKTALLAALEELNRPWESVRVLATHSHPDHIGLLGSLAKPSYPVLGGMSGLDEIQAYDERSKVAYNVIEGRMRADLQAGILNYEVKSLDEIESHDTSGVDACEGFDFSDEYVVSHVNADFQKVSEGDIVTAGLYNFEVLETPGHDQWHICLYDKAKGVIVVGDHVLRRITPAIGCWHPDQDSLGQYLDSLRRLPRSGVSVVLPAHGKPVYGLNAEVDRIIAHHVARLEEFYELVRDGYDNVVTISANVGWRYDNWYSWAAPQQIMSMGETLAHLFRLAHEGRIEVLNEGRYLYRFVPR